MLKGHAKNNPYARFESREIDFNARVDEKIIQSQWNVKCRSMATDHSVC